MVDNWFYARLPHPPDHLILKSIAFNSILLIYFTGIAIGFGKLSTHYFSKNKAAKPDFNKCKPIKTCRNKSRSKGRHNKKCCCTPRLEITMLAHDLKSGPSEKIFTPESDGVSFIIDNSATGAICNERSLFVGKLPHMRYH